MSKSKIPWTEYSWNPIAGCTKCSPGCLNCYAEKMARRQVGIGTAKYKDTINILEPPAFEWSGIINCDEKSLDKPLHWRKPRKIFVCSMSDLFHPKVPFEFIDKVLEQVFLNKRHTFQVLTKRPERMLEYYTKVQKRIDSQGPIASNTINFMCQDNLWLGTSISTQAEADEKIPILLEIPAAVRFVSLEPMLEGIDLPEMLPGHYWYDWEKGCLINWVIVGAESGPKRRPCKLEWVESIVDQCKAANVPIFVKQIHKDGKLVKMPAEFLQEYPNS